jgi:hypothetical protein
VTKNEAIPALVIGLTGTFAGAALGANWHGWATRLRDATIRSVESRSRLVRGSSDAPESAYRAIAVLGGLISCLMLAASIAALASR